MRLSSKKLSVEDFKEQQSWIAKLLQPLNDFFSQVNQGFNNGLTVEDNLSQEIKEIKFLNNSTNFPLSFKTKFATNPKGLTLIYCVDSSNADLTVQPCLNWSYNNGIITIRSITGLVTSNTYTIRLLVIYS